MWGGGRGQTKENGNVKGDMVDGDVRNGVFAAAFETLSPKGREQDDEIYEKWVDHTIELARLVQSDRMLSAVERFHLLKPFVGGFERADEEKRRVLTEIVEKAQAAGEYTARYEELSKMNYPVIEYFLLLCLPGHHTSFRNTCRLLFIYSF